MILLDNTVLSNYALIGQLDLLRSFCGGKGVTTDAVVKEFQTGIALGLFKETDIGWVRVTKVRGESERSLFERFQRRLEAGESSCLAVAVSRKHGILTDDIDAREVALRASIQVSGSIGVLVAMIRRGVIDLQEGNRLLKGPISVGFLDFVELAVWGRGVLEAEVDGFRGHGGPPGRRGGEREMPNKVACSAKSA